MKIFHRESCVQLWSPLSRRAGSSWNSCKEDMMTGNVAVASLCCEMVLKKLDIFRLAN